MAEFEGVRKRISGTVELWRFAREKGLPFWARLLVAATYLREGAAGFSLIGMGPSDRWRGRRRPDPPSEPGP